MVWAYWLLLGMAWATHIPMRFYSPIEANNTKQVRTFSYEVLGPISSHEVILLLQVHRRQEVLCGKGGCSMSAPTRHTASTRGLACEAAGQNRVYKSRLGFNLVTGAEVRNCPRRGFQTQFSSLDPASGTIPGYAFDGGSRGPEAA